MLVVWHYVIAERDAYSLSIPFYNHKLFSGTFSIYKLKVLHDWVFHVSKISIRGYSYCCFIVFCKMMFIQGWNHIKPDAEYVFAVRIISLVKLHRRRVQLLVQFPVVLDPADFHFDQEISGLTRLVQTLLWLNEIQKINLSKIKSKDEDLLYNRDYQH